MSLGLGLGIHKERTRGGGSLAAWYLSGKADDTDPSFWADFANDRYAVNGAEEAFSDIFTFTRSTTGTYFDASGVMQTAAIDSPRFDHDPSTGEKLGLLLEEQRTNLSIQSGISSPTVYAGAVSSGSTATDGVSSMARYTEDTSTTEHGIASYNVSSTSYTSGTTYAMSCFVRKGTETIVQVSGHPAAIPAYANFDLVNGICTGGGTGYVSCNMSKIGSSGDLWRLVLIANAQATKTVLPVFVLGTNNNYGAARAPSYTGSGKYFEAWGAQIEAGSFATSYIPTTSSAVTRSRDDLHADDTNTVTVSSWTSSSEECSFVRGTQMGVANTAPRLFDLSAGNTSSLIILSNTSVTVQYQTTGTIQASFSSTVDTGIEVKAAISAKVNDFASCVNGQTVQTDVAGTFGKRTTIEIGDSVGNNRNLNGHVKEFRYYPIRVTNASLQELTT